MTLIIAVTILIIMGPYIIFILSERRDIKNKKAWFKNILFVNIVSFFGVLVATTLFMTVNVYAAAPYPISGQERGMAYLAAALVTGMCTIGTGIATGQAAQAALGAISENEGLMGKALIFVGLAEGIAIYGLLISFTILARV